MTVPGRADAVALAHQPALDGVRGLAVAMVLVFHGGFRWMPGGYVGVSVFFTLSGYLITSLALIEHRRRGGLDVVAFWGRRARRLLPASLLCLAGVVVLAALGAFQDVEQLPRDVAGALAEVANWVSLAGDRSYADLVATTSTTGAPLDHYWSLAIEEQFYLVWPLVLVGVLRLRRHGRVVAMAAMVLIAGVAAPLIATTWGPDAAYWATPARLAEILVGALLAVALQLRGSTPHPRWWRWLGIGGLAVVLLAGVTWPSGDGPAYTGWFPVFALASAALLLGLQVDSAARRALSWPPLVALGVISYGVYLFHWPIFLAVDERTGLDRAPLFALRVTLTLAVAIGSFVLLERPIRRGRVAWRPLAMGGVVSVSAIGVAAFVVPVGERWATSSVERSAPVDERELAGVAAPVSTSTSSVTTSVAPVAPRAARPDSRAADSTTAATVPLTVPPTAPPTVPATVPPTTAPPTTLPATTSAPTVPTAPALPASVTRPVRVLVVGDSTASATGDGMVGWANAHPDLAEVVVAAQPGCGFIRAGIIPTDPDDGFRRRCAELLDETLPDELADFQPDVVLAMVTMRDLEDRVWDAAEGPLTPLDDRFTSRLLADYLAFTTQLVTGAGVAKVLFVVPPIPDLPVAAGVLDPARHRRYREVLEAVTQQFPGRAAIIDVAGWLAVQPDAPQRKDGLHWSDDGALQLADRYLGPSVIVAALS